VKLTHSFNGSLPFLFMVFATMDLDKLFPQLTLWLPDYHYAPREDAEDEESSASPHTR
jgi:TRAP-type mannitol/chloroaromatic compound transport system permease large subunit